ncbi:MAG: M56 family metallopeptidase, partial [Acidobacteriota bacterium]
MSPFLVTLVALSAKATLVALVVLGVQRLLAGWMPAGFRHALWLLVALRLVIPSLPESPTSLFIAAHPETTLPALVEWLPEPPVPVFAHPPSTEPPAEVVASTSPIAMALVLLWLGGLLIVSSRLGKAHRDLRRLLKHATPIESGPTHQLFDRVRQQLSLRRRVRLLGSTELDGPAACGILRPTVLVPVDFASQRSQTEQTHALLHELAHLKRHDALWLHLAHLAMAIHWFNPFLWLARRQFHADLEAACDATVLGHLKRPERANYGRTVLAFGVRPSLAAQSLGFAVGSHRQLTQRIHMITTFRSPTRRRITLLFALSAALIAVTLTDLPAAFADNTAEAELFIHDVLKLYESKDEYEKTTAWAQAIADRVESARLPDAVMVEALRREADRQENADEASELPVQLRYLAGVIVQEAGGPPSASP